MPSRFRTSFRHLFKTFLSLVLSCAIFIQGCSATRVKDTEIVRGNYIRSEKVPLSEQGLSCEKISPLSIKAVSVTTNKEKEINYYSRIKKTTTITASDEFSMAPVLVSIILFPLAPLVMKASYDRVEKGVSRCSYHGELVWDSGAGIETKCYEAVEEQPEEGTVTYEEETVVGKTESPAASAKIPVTVNGEKGEIVADANGVATLRLTDFASVRDTKRAIAIEYDCGGDEPLRTELSASEGKKILSATWIPPNLKIESERIVLGGGLKTGTLVGDTSGEISVSVTNADKEGTAWGVKMAVSGNRCQGVSFDPEVPMGNLAPGAKKTVRIPVKAALEARNCKLDLSLQAMEQYGNNSRKVIVPAIAIKGLARPKLAITGIAQSGTAQNGRSVELTATVSNGGPGEGKGVVLALGELPEGITPSWKKMDLGDMPAGSTQKVPLTLQFDKLYGKGQKSLAITLSVSDRRKGTPSPKSSSLDFHYVSPRIKVAGIEYFDGNDPGGVSEGNGNGLLEQDELILARVQVTNAGEMTAENVLVSMTPDRAPLAVSPSEPVLIPSLRPNESKTLEFKFRIPNSLEAGPVDFKVQAVEKAFSLQVAEVSRKTIYESAAIQGVAITAGAKPSLSKVSRPVERIENIDEVPQAGYKREDAYALVIGIGRYKLRGIKQLQFARNDAQVMRDYLEKIGGIPRDRIHVLTNEQATLTEIRKELGWIRKSAGEKSQVFIYYSGHGVADARNNPYLLPFDGDTAAVEDTGLSLSVLKGEVNKFQTRQVLIVLDACYTGEGRSESMPGKRGVAWADADPTPTEACLIHSSALKESSWDYDEKQHGIFTYFFLKGMRGAAPELNGDGFVDASEIYEYVKKEVPAAALKSRQASQTPVFQGSGKPPVISKRIE